MGLQRIDIKFVKHSTKTEKPKRKSYDPRVLHLAFDQARRTGKIREFSRDHNLPYSTLQRYLQKAPKSNKPGPNTILLPEEEAKIEEWILYMSRAGFPISECNLTHTVTEYAEKIRKTRELPESFPSKNWSQCYLKRHPANKKK
ncbi:uncharacterized protein LOC129730654 [Wyeomyia smithii]|uniref:uncharacterized protein LOC129730654 n=1 Tax=Wyeomyia smithii TaxID=174621 RepID=UPI002467C74F|nr:uncharacterized protein LOC129730654 [Wyeomyia smithii]